MQSKGKLMKKTWENSKKSDFGPDFHLFGPNLGTQNFFCGFYFYYMLNIVASYHCIQFEGKRMIQTQENGKKPHFGLDLGPLGKNSDHQFFFS